MAKILIICLSLKLLMIVKYSTAFNKSVFIKSVLAGYDASVRPIRNDSVLTTASVWYTLESLGTLNEKTQQLSTNSWFTIQWHDDFIGWNISDGTEPKTLYLSSSYIWTPRIVILNSVDDSNQLDFTNSNVFIKHSGEMLAINGGICHTSCELRVDKFPFDTQTCQIIVMPSDGGLSQVNVHINTKQIIISQYRRNNEWELKTVDAETVTVSVSFFEFQQAVITITMTRHSMSHVLNSLVPVICLSFLNNMVFFLPAESGERVSLSLSVLMSYAIYLTYINAYLPTNSDKLCYFSIYLVCLILKSSLIAALTIISLHLHRKPNASVSIGFRCTRRVTEEPLDGHNDTVKTPTILPANFDLACCILLSTTSLLLLVIFLSCMMS